MKLHLLFGVADLYPAGVSVRTVGGIPPCRRSPPVRAAGETCQMAPCTANYQLRQREPRDNFLRTDFNQDLARINAAWRGFQGGSSARALVGVLFPAWCRGRLPDHRHGNRFLDRGRWDPSQRVGDPVHLPRFDLTKKSFRAYVRGTPGRKCAGPRKAG